MVAPVAAAAQFLVQLLGAADPFVPPLAQPVPVRAEQTRAAQGTPGNQLVRGGGGGVAAGRLAVEP